MLTHCFRSPRAYDTSRFYRDIRIRSTLILSDKKLHPLRYEEIADTLDGVWNLSGEKGESGSMFVTNIRTVWYSDVDERFNVSLPYNQVVRRAECPME